MEKKSRKAVYLLLANIYEQASTKVSSLAAREFLLSEGYSNFICNNLGYLGYERAVINYPEFSLFEPSVPQDLHGGGWFSIETVDGFAERASVLYLCAEMCK